MRKYSGILLFLILPAVFAAGEAPAPTRNRATDPVTFQERFLSDFQALFEMLGREYPQFRNRLSSQDADKALAALLEGLGSGVIPVPDGKNTALPGSASAPAGKRGNTGKTETSGKNPPEVRLANGLMYLRLNVIDAHGIERLMEVLGTEGKGVILDLRSCSGGNGEELAFRLSHFLAGKRGMATAHIAILTGPSTRGAAEILGAMLTASRKGIRIGEPTAGEPYHRKSVRAGSRNWLVPVPPEGAEQVRYAKLRPQIAISSVPQAPYDKVCAGRGAFSGDRCLSRAADLLVSLDLLDQKGLKK